MSGWGDLAPDVQAVLDDAGNRKQNRHLSPQERKEKARQASRIRVTYDVPDWLKYAMQAIAKEEMVSASSLGAWFLAQGIKAYREGDRPSKEECLSPRFEFIVVVDEAGAGL